MTFTLTMKCDNAAFEAPDLEVARILREIAERVESGHEYGPVRDCNGNTVGRFELKGGGR